jgi:carboxyl-terminal processing protease
MTNSILRRFEPHGTLIPGFALNDVVPGIQFVASDYSKVFGPSIVVYPQKIKGSASLVQVYERLEADRKRYGDYWEKVFRIYPEDKIPFDDILNWMTRYFIGTEETPYIVGTALNAFTRNYFDPHSEFVPTAALNAWSTTEAVEEIFGIGISLAQVHEKWIFKEVIEGGPAQRAGVQEKDVLVSVASKDKAVEVGSKTPLNGVTGLLRGPKGTNVSITVKRGDKTLTFSITRAPVQLRVVSQKMLPDNQTSYIRIQEMFLESKYFCDAFAMALARSVGKGAKRIVLDLRDNRGGYLQNVVCLADFLLPPSSKVYRATPTRPNSKIKPDFWITDPDAKFFSTDAPIVILTNSKTASSAEIVAGTIQENADLHKLPYFVLGERSFGKGSFQGTVEHELGTKFRDKIEFRATLGLFYLPSGRTPQIDGITPDFEVYNIPNPSDEQKFQMREENNYVNFIHNPNNIKWQRSQRSQLQVNAIKDCLASEGKADKLFETESLVTEPDYQLMVAIDTLNCIEKLGIKSESDATPTQLLQEVWTKYRTRLDSLP